jgi:hypothetical protein
MLPIALGQLGHKDDQADENRRQVVSVAQSHGRRGASKALAVEP